jgi:hypothetical protein
MAPNALPTFQVEDRIFTRLILGHNPFLGYSYISNARSAEYKERFNGPEPIRDVILAAIECGVRSMMISSNEPIAQAIEMAQAQSGVELSNLVIVSPGVREQRDWLKRVGCQVCLVHGQNTDSFFRRSERTFAPEFGEMLAEIRDCGFVPGMSTHNGGETIPCAEGFDVQVINTPINKIAWRMCPCVEQVLGEVKRSSKPIIAMKSLAMGRIAPPEAMEYIASVPGVNGVVVGIGTAAEAEETFGLGAEAMARNCG